jgi:hypothetical protein
MDGQPPSGCPNGRAGPSALAGLAAVLERLDRQPQREIVLPQGILDQPPVQAKLLGGFRLAGSLSDELQRVGEPLRLRPRTPL